MVIPIVESTRTTYLVMSGLCLSFFSQTNKMADMLTEVSQAFNTLRRNFPQLKNILDRCYNEIRNLQNKRENADELQAQKKEKVKNVLESSINMRPLNTTFDDLLTEAANNEDQLIEVLKR